MKRANLFRDRVVAVVCAIPRGRVLTYGQVAFLIGTPRGARQVGRVLYLLGPLTSVPWQRVVNRFGGLSTYKIGRGDVQRRLLEAEGIRFEPDGTLELQSYQWRPREATIRKMKQSKKSKGKGQK